MVVSKKAQVDTAKPVRKDTRRTAILVLGMHRSGTSALTRVLNLLGCDLPKTLMPATANNEAGHWESDVIYRLNDRILESAGSAWNDWQEFNAGWFDSPRADEFRDQAVTTLAEEYGSSRLFVLKDPRNCRLLPFWLDVLERCEVRPLALLPLRNPLEVSASLEKRDGFDPALGNLLWLRHVLEAEAASRDIPRLFLTYDQLMQGWGRLVKNAREKLDIAWPRLSDRSAAEIDAFLSDKLRHHRRPPESVIDNPGLSDWLRDTFVIVEKWAHSGEGLEERSTLDGIRHDFNAAAPAFSRLIVAGESARHKAAKLERSLSEETNKLGALEAKAAAAEQKSVQLQQELEVTRNRAAEVEKKVSEVQAELVKRVAALQAADAARADSESKKAATEAAVAEQRAKATALEKDLATQRQKAADASALAAKLQAELDERVVALQAADAVRAEIQEKHGVTEAAVAEQRKQASALEKELAVQRQHADDAVKRVAELQAELEQYAIALQEAEAARAEAESRYAESGLTAAAERERATQLENDLGVLRAGVEDAGRELAALRAELAEQAEDAAAAESAAAELRDSLSQTQSALAQRSLEAEETAAALAIAREELRHAAALQGESEKVVNGFRDHVTLLMADLKERQAAYAMLESAGRDQFERTEAMVRRASEAEARLAMLEQEHRRRKDERNDEIARLREELDKTEKQRAEAEKIAAGLKEHVRLLLSDAEQLRAEAAQKPELQQQDAEIAKLRQELAEAKAAVETERRKVADEAGKAKANVEIELTKIRSELAKAKADADDQRGRFAVQVQALETETEKLRAEKAATERMAGSERATLERRLRERFDEIAALTRMISAAERQTDVKGKMIDDMRLAVAQEMGRTVSALLNGTAWRFVPARIRVRRQMALLRRSGLFDAEWYRSHYQDIAEAGVDPLRHYVVHGALEGREPNRTLAQMKSSATRSRRTK